MDVQPCRLDEHSTEHEDHVRVCATREYVTAGGRGSHDAFHCLRKLGTDSL